MFLKTNLCKEICSHLSENKAAPKSQRKEEKEGERRKKREEEKKQWLHSAVELWIKQNAQH